LSEVIVKTLTADEGRSDEDCWNVSVARLSLTPLEAERTRIDVSCKGGGASDGAAAGFVVKMIRKPFNLGHRPQAALLRRGGSQGRGRSAEFAR
jgi:hypothetical protein